MSRIYFILSAILMLFVYSFAYANEHHGSHHDRHERHHKHDSHPVVVSFNFTQSNPAYPERGEPIYIGRKPHHRHHELQWIPADTGYPLPPEAVVGGREFNRSTPLYICRASYRGGVHPGKVVDGRCNIAWGGQETSFNHYELLMSRARLTWTPASNGYVPHRAIEGGFENGRPLYICQAHYRGGVHPGKIVGSTCNIPWGGREISLPNYYVLTR